MDNACGRYQDSGNASPLEGLLEATKDLLNIDRSNIFLHLLKLHCKFKSLLVSSSCISLLLQVKMRTATRLSACGRRLKTRTFNAVTSSYKFWATTLRRRTLMFHLLFRKQAKSRLPHQGNRELIQSGKLKKSPLAPRSRELRMLILYCRS
jgi:hypothetical protein